MRKITISTPIYVDMGRIKSKKRYINLNSYRNWQFTLSNNIKKKFKEAIKNQFPNFDSPIDKYELHYQIYLPNKLERDVMNIGAIVDKFTNDALVEEGVVLEDNYKHLQHIEFDYEGYDDEKEGYVIVTVTEVNKLKPV